MKNEQSNSENLRNFAMTFFNNIGAKFSEHLGLLIVEKIPKEFEEFSGKKTPFKIRFDKSDGESEFLTKGSILLKTMMNYIESRGQTTIIKIKFEEDFKKELEKYFSLRNCKISSFGKKTDYKCIIRFSIATTLQYLNEKEQITNHICVEDGKIKDFSLEKYEYMEGRKEDIPEIELKKEYEIAKEELKKLTENRVKDTAKNLSEKLEKEIQRIKNHYDKQKEEINNGLKKLSEQKRNLEIQLEKSKPEEIEQIKSKIIKVNDSISQTEKSGFAESLEKEKEFFIADEKNKHSLKINNKLINTSIVYYPIYTFEIFLKSAESIRKTEIVYEPMKDILLKNINCDSCKREIREIFLCSSGHLSCSSCHESCIMCHSALCISCTKKRCEMCARKLCKKCGVKCNSCWKTICKSHSNKDFTDGKIHCMNCLEKCRICEKFTTKNKIRNKDGEKICERCLRISSIKESKSGLF